MRIVSLTNSNHRLLHEGLNGDLLIQLENGSLVVVFPMGHPIHHTNYYVMNIGKDIGYIMVPVSAYKGCSREEIEISIKVMIKLKPNNIYEEALPF